MKSDIKNKNTAPKVKSGVAPMSPLAPNLVQKLKKKKRINKSISEYIEGILSGNRILLSQAITLIESTKKEHSQLAQTIIEKCLPHAGNSTRIGITGTPGVGKSTFIETFGKHITQQQKKVAVLAIDPSSQVSRGSILGDKTRMAQLAIDPNAFIRPSPAGNSLGGVARKTRETIILCEASGFDAIIVETVGVGQSEIAVRSMVDFFLLLLNPGAGDELQGIKRGIVEAADLVTVNKADGELLASAKRAKSFYRNALHLFPPQESGWIPKTELCSAITGDGIDKIYTIIQNYREQMEASNWWQKNRHQQDSYWLTETIHDRLQRLFYEHPEVAKHKSLIEKAVLEGQLSPFQGAEKLLRLFEGRV